MPLLGAGFSNRHFCGSFRQGPAQAKCFLLLLLNAGEEMRFLSLDVHFSRQDNISYR